MLVKFAVTNYRGFANRIEWDLSKPSNYSFNTFAIKDGIIKNGIVYGPNGSGKSNCEGRLWRHGAGEPAGRPGPVRSRSRCRR